MECIYTMFSRLVVNKRSSHYNTSYAFCCRPKHAATVTDPKSGRGMKVLTTAPGVQFYTGNFLNGSIVGKDNYAYPQHGGFCLETQSFPDSINQPKFPSIVLRPDEGAEYLQIMQYHFFTQD